MTVSKRVAKSGAVTLPRQLRQETGILPGVPVDIEADEDGVHIRKHVPTCHFCGTVDDVKTVCGIDVQKRSWRSLKDNGCGGSKKEG